MLEKQTHLENIARMLVKKNMKDELRLYPIPLHQLWSKIILPKHYDIFVANVVLINGMVKKLF